jgi:hypothetical protein
MMIGIGTPRSQSKIPRPKLPSSCCVGANSVRAMNFAAPQFVPCEKGTFHACLLPISPVSGRWKTSAKSDPSSIASSRRSLLTSASGIRERGRGLKLKPIAGLDALVDAGVDRVAALEPSAATIDGVPLQRRTSTTPLARGGFRIRLVAFWGALVIRASLAPVASRLYARYIFNYII